MKGVLILRSYVMCAALCCTAENLFALAKSERKNCTCDEYQQMAEKQYANSRKQTMVQRRKEKQGIRKRYFSGSHKEQVRPRRLRYQNSGIDRCFLGQ